ncbi:ECF-type sigma factor [Aquisphaera insulae]|uniref:ECF-type sigma factor n=1 Tax=Aquisphaera insulae TaxID=2712864 RepID=UPI0013EBEF0D|nr:ECF-type sigma factor [Aquisphaera insulae]
MSLRVEGDVTRWIGEMRNGDPESVKLLWDRYYGHLVRIARSELQKRYNAEGFDAEDVALSAFHVACRKLGNGRYEGVSRRDEFARLLMRLLFRKMQEYRCAAHRGKRGGGRKNVDGIALAELFDPGYPEGIALSELFMKDLLEFLPNDQLRLIAIWRLEGYTHLEIADRLYCSVATVKRKLTLIRERWSGQLG